MVTTAVETRPSTFVPVCFVVSILQPDGRFPIVVVVEYQTNEFILLAHFVALSKDHVVVGELMFTFSSTATDGVTLSGKALKMILVRRRKRTENRR